MTSTSAFVDFSITVCGIEELGGHAEAGITHVLSILDPGWPDPSAFGAFGEYERLLLHFDDIVDESPGKALPQPQHVEALLQFGRDIVVEPRAHLLVHCHMGMSRSTAAMTLILAQARPDRPAAEALAEVVRIRRVAWPNLRMIELGDAMLGRNGELIEAVAERYRYVIERRPAVVDEMKYLGRSREVMQARAGG